MDPYKNGMNPDNIYHTRIQVTGKIVSVMKSSIEERGLVLIPQPTRAFQKNDIVELIATEEDVDKNRTINSISYIGFVEINDGGVVKNGDTVIVNDEVIGEIKGYDETHMPNHLNMIIGMEKKKTGLELNIQINDVVILKHS